MIGLDSVDWTNCFTDYNKFLKKIIKKKNLLCVIHPCFLENKEEKGGRGPRVKPGAAGGVNVQKDVSLASANPNARGPVTREPAPRGPGALPGNPQDRGARGRARGAPRE